MEKEEDDNAQVIFSQMELYQDFTSSGEGNEVDEEADSLQYTYRTGCQIRKRDSC